MGSFPIFPKVRLFRVAFVKNCIYFLKIFKNIFYHHFYNIDSPSILNRINIFFFISIRIFKIKLYNYISFLISNLNSFKFKKISIFFGYFNFEKLYIIFLQYSLLLIILSLVL